MRLRRLVHFPVRVCRYFEIDPFLAGVFISLSVCWAFVLGCIPYLDGAIDFNKAVDFFRGGFPELFANWASVHPPFKETLLSLIFHFFGINTVSYAIVGLPFLYLGLYSCYVLSMALGGKRMARLSIFLLVTNPLFLATSVFSLTDFLLSCLLLFSFVTFFKRHWVLWTLSLIGLVFVKEPGVIVPILFLFSTIFLWVLSVVRVIRYEKKPPLWPPIIALLLFSSWFFFLGRFEKQLWGDWVFSEKPANGIFQAVINNVLTGTFINPYAKENFLHLFVLNYAWVYWLIGIGGLLWLLGKHFRKIRSWILTLPIDINLRLETVFVMILFCGGYTLSVLRFPTFAIPRYTLPVEVIVLVGFAYVFDRILNKKTKGFVILFFCILTLARLFTSTDPVSRYLWKTETIGTQTFYALRHYKAGNDGITYNLEYVIAVAQRSKQIREADREGRAVYAPDCFWAFPDIKNDQRTLFYLGFVRIPESSQCMTVMGL